MIAASTPSTLDRRARLAAGAVVATLLALILAGTLPERSSITPAEASSNMRPALASAPLSPVISTPALPEPIVPIGGQIQPEAGPGVLGDAAVTPLDPTPPPEPDPTAQPAAAPPTVAIPTSEPQPPAGGSPPAEPPAEPPALPDGVPDGAQLVQNPDSSFYQVPGSQIQYHTDGQGTYAVLPGVDGPNPGTQPSPEPTAQPLAPAASRDAACPGRARGGQCGGQQP
jgi:hypothetical protein